jgi:hypothetical protein
MADKSKPAATPERIMKAAWGYAAPLILETGVRIGVFDALAGGPKTVAEVQTATGASERGLRIKLNALVGLGLLTKSDPTRYALTPDADAFLVSSKPAYLGGFLRHTSSHLIPKWLQLAEVVKSGRPAEAVNQEGTGAEFFEKFVEDLFPMNYAAADALADALAIESATGPVAVLDLAAGSGVWSIALAKRSPHVRVTAVDWPGVLPATRRTAERHGVADRFRFVAGDLLSADFGIGYQVATLGHILHSEGEARSRALLAKTAAAMAPGGTIAIAEWLVDADRTGPPMGLVFAVNMLVNTDQGDTFSFDEIAGWLKAVGFVNARTLDVPGPAPLVLATKAGRGTLSGELRRRRGTILRRGGRRGKEIAPRPNQYPGGLKVSATATIKDEARRIVDQLPEGASWEDLVYRIYVRQSIEAGIRDADAGRVESVADVRRSFGLPE